MNALATGELDLEQLRQRLRKMNDGELLRFGQAAKYNRLESVFRVSDENFSVPKGVCQYLRMHRRETVQIRPESSRSNCGSKSSRLQVGG